MESLEEYFIMELERPLADIAATREILDGQFPSTMEIVSIVLAAREKPTDLQAVYQVEVASLPPGNHEQALHRFLAARQWPVERLRKGKRKTIDIRPLVLSAVQKDDVIEFVLLHPHGRAGMGPYEVMEQLLALDREQARAARITKIAMRPVPGQKPAG